MLRKVDKWLGLSTEPAISIAQYGAIKRQMPLMYSLLIVNSMAVSYTHHADAPSWLVVYVPLVLIVASLWRLLVWSFGRKAETIDPQRARERLRGSILVSVPICIGFTAWALQIDQYGGSIEHGHVAIFIAVTMIGCIACLMHIPQAAFVVVAFVALPYLIYTFIQGNNVFIAIAANITLVTAVLVKVMHNSFVDFNGLIEAKQRLATEQTDAVQLSELNARLAMTDALTGLPNRRQFFLQLEDLLSTRKLSGERFVVGVFDLDRFKAVNDSFGHLFGDCLLAEVGERFGNRADASLTIARLGGDEFGVLITGDVDRAREIGQGLCDLVARPYEIDGNRVALGCSGGLATFPEAGISAHALFDRSDYTLYHVKSAQRGTCALFSLEHETLIRSERSMESALQGADLDAELHVQFQPIVSTETMTVFGVEALGRWTSPLVGVVAPDQFITTAERLGIIHAITLKLFHKALAGLKTMPASLELSFNLSAHDIIAPSTVSGLIAEITEAGVNPKRVTFELTETALLMDFDAAVIGIKRLRGLGSRIALDDFGAGYSSLGYLHRLPLDRIKVDRSFVADIDKPSGSNIIKAILGLCRALGLDCIIEGVETEAQLHQLRILGYRMAQGYFFARPMPLDGFLSWLGSAWSDGLRGPVDVQRLKVVGPELELAAASVLPRAASGR